MSAAPPPDEDRRLEELLAAYVEARDTGAAITPETFVADHPEAGDRLLGLLRAVASTEELLGPPPTAGLPERIGPFEVVGVLGRGASGTVFEARGDAGSVAVKLLAPGGAQDPRAAERFRREGAILSRLSHPGIARLVDAGVDTATGAPYIAMHLVEGASLARLLAWRRAADPGAGEAPPPLREVFGAAWSEDRESLRAVARFTAAIARALQAAHAAGVVHRDLKPGNVVVTTDGRPVLVDFGLGRDVDAPGLTRTGDVVGTPSWMAPEQARGERCDERSDVYALGAILHELLTLEPPHQGAHALEILERVRRAPAPPIRTRRRGVPKALAVLVDRCLAFDARLRPRSAGFVAEQLEAFADGRPVELRPLPWLARLRSALRRHPRPVAVAGLVALAAVVTVLVTRGGGGGRVDPEAARRSLVDRAALAWIEGDAAGLLAAAAALPGGTVRDDELARFVRALATGEALGEFEDPAVGDLAAAASALRAGRHAEAAAPLRAAVAALPRCSLAVVMLGATARRAGDFDLALAELTAARRLLPDSAPLLLEIARTRLDRGEGPAASEAAAAALRLAPTSETAHFLASRAAYLSGDVEGGLAIARSAVERLGARGPELLNAYGAFLDARGDRDAARSVFRDLLDRDPGHVEARFNLARSLDSDHDVLQAEKLYLEVVDAAPRNVAALACLAWLYSGGGCDATCTRAHLVDLDRAEAMEVRALEADGGANRGLVLAAPGIAARVGRTGRIKAALEALLPAAEGTVRAGWIQQALRRLDAAERQR